MKTPLADLTEGLNWLQDTFAPFANIPDGEVVEIPAASVRTLVSSISVMKHLVHLADREIGALRMAEDGRKIASIIDDEITDALSDNVLRPEFGGRR